MTDPLITVRTELTRQHNLLTGALAHNPHNAAILRRLLRDVRNDMLLPPLGLLAVAGFIGPNGRGPAVDTECRQARSLSLSSVEKKEAA